MKSGERISALLSAMGMLALVFVWQSKLPPVDRLVSITLPIEQSVAVAGSKEFSGSGIEGSHIAFYVQPDKSVMLKNISGSHTLKAFTDYGVLDAGFAFLKNGQHQISFNGQALTIDVIGERLQLTLNKAHYTYLHGEVVGAPSCSVKEKISDFFEQILPDSAELTVGGVMSCRHQLGMLGDTTIKLKSVKDGWVLSSTKPQTVFILVAGTWVALNETPCASHQFILGKTTYKIRAVNSQALTIVPVKRIPLYHTSTLVNEKLQLDSLLGKHQLMLYFCVYIAALLLLSTSWVMQILLIISCFGFINQFNLALGAHIDSLYASSSLLMLIITAVIALGALALKCSGFIKINVQLARRFIFLAIITVVFLQTMQVFIGNEIGLAGSLNPLELMKLLLAMVLGVCLARLCFFQNSLLAKALCINIGVVLVASGYAFAVALLLNDYSTIVVVCGMLVNYTLLLIRILRNKKITHFRVIGWTMLILLVMANCILFLVVELISEEISIDWYALPSADRLKSFFLSVQSMTDGLQQKKAALVLQQADLFPSNTLQQFNVPAIESDYAYSYFIASAGGLLGSLCAALMLVLCVFLIYKNKNCIKLLLKPSANIELENRQLLVLIALVLSLLNSALLAHVLLSLCVNLQLVPVMGVPTLFFSIGQSHVLLFVVPTIVANVLLNNYMEKF